MKKGLKILLVVLGVLVLAVVAVVVLALAFINPGVKAGVEKGGSYALKVPVTLDKASVSILGGKASLQGLTVANPKEFKTPKAIYLGEAAVEIKIGSLTSEVIEIPELRVISPQITVEGSLKGSNISRLLKNLDETIAQLPADSGKEPQPKPEPAPKAEGPEQKYKVGKILITDAQLGLSAGLMGGREATAKIPRIEITPGEEPMTMAELMKKIIGDVLREGAKNPDQAGKLLGEVVLDSGLGAAGQAGDLIKKGTDQAGDAVKKGTETINKVKDLFKKKPE